MRRLPLRYLSFAIDKHGTLFPVIWVLGIIGLIVLWVTNSMLAAVLSIFAPIVMWLLVGLLVAGFSKVARLLRHQSPSQPAQLP